MESQTVKNLYFFIFHFIYSKKKIIILRIENDNGNMENICAHLSSPATSIPLYNPPTLPFRMWRHKSEPTLPYKYPICVPCSAIALSALKHKIDLSKYDFVGIRRSIKRILSFSNQLNTNFQCINGTIFAEDVPISEKYFPFNLVTLNPEI